MKNIKTTWTGIVILALGVVLIYIGKTAEGIICIPIGIGFLNTKDDNVTGGTKGATEEAKERIEIK